MIDTIPEHLRTSTVCGLVRAMPEHGYATWPLLVDALRDADATDADLADALMACILCRKDDDDLRLAWADAVGGDRGEFVKVQTTLASWATWAEKQFLVLPESKEGRHINNLLHRERQLWDAIRCPWAGFEWVYPPDGRYDQTKRGSPHLSDMRRGFVAEVACSWSDWLKHHTALYWHPEQTIQDHRKCHENRDPRKDVGDDFEWRHHRFCKTCAGTGVTNHSIPRPIPPTAQPLETVRLTDELLWRHPPRTEAGNMLLPSLGGARSLSGMYRFDREKCPTCGGSGSQCFIEAGGIVGKSCPGCGGTQPSRWTCEAWPGVAFEMPDERPIYTIEEMMRMDEPRGGIPIR
jgi:hypothetical protein